jgi:hypothetical protein
MNQELDNRIESARLAGNNKCHTADEFRYYLFMLGLLKYESEILPCETGKPYIPYPLRGKPTQQKTRLQAAGCETTPRSIGKIIPFPGVSLDTGGIQGILDDFLSEMGYVE